MITSEQAQELGYLLDPCFQIVNTAGKPVTNGYIEIYLHGTRVKYYAFSDWNGSLHPFQIPLDSLGSNIVLADPANSYDVYVYNAFGTLLMSRYNVKVSAANAQGGGSAPVTSATVPAMFLGEYGQRVPVLENQTGLPLPLPTGDYNTYTHNADEIIDHYDSEGLYMYLKPGVFFVNATIRFRQNRDDIKNKVTNVKIFTGNGNWNEVNCNKLDCTGQHAEDDYNYIHCTFIRVNDSEDTDFGRFSSGILYFRPLVYDSSWEECCIQRLEIVKLNTIGGEGGQSYIPGDYVSIVGNVISVTGVLPESATGDFVKYDEFNTEIQNIHNEIDNLEITVQNATAQIVEQTTEIVTAVVEEVAPPMVTSIIERELAGVTGDFATRDELESATGNLQDQIDNIQPGVQSDWTQSATGEPDYIKNKPDIIPLVAGQNIAIDEVNGEIVISAEGGQPTGDYVERDELENVTSQIESQIENVSSQIPELPQEEEVEFEEVDLSVYATKNELQSATSEIINVIETVTGNVPTGAVTHEELENATSVLQNEIETVSSNIPELPEEEEVEFEELDLSDYATVSELETVTANVLDQATGAIPAQVQSDWTESDSSDPSYIQNKPNELSLVEGTNIHITKSGNEVIISADNGATGAVTQSELATATANLQSEIETVTGDVIDTVTAMIPEAQVQSDWTESDTNDPAYIQNKPALTTLVEGENVHITASGDYIVISAEGGQVTGDYVERDELEAVTAEVLDQATANIPAQVQSDWTQTVTGDPSYIKHKPDTLPLVAGDNVTINEVNGEIVISAQGGVTGDFVETSELEAATAEIQTEIENVSSNIPELPDEEEVEFEELDLSDYATTADVSALESELQSVTASIPSTDNLATKAELATATGDIQAEIETVSSMITPELPVVGGTGIGITETSTEITIAVTGDYVSSAELATATAEVESDIPDVSNLATKAELATATGDIQAEIETVTASIPELPAEEEVDFEEVDLSDYAPATAITAVEADIQTVSSSIPDTSDMATKTWVGNQGYLTSVPATYVTESELATATAAIESDIPVVTGFATKSEVTSGLNGKQNTLTGITDVQLVQALPASPVATVLYLIPEA